MLLHNIVLCATLGLLFDPINAASIQKRSMIASPGPASAAYHGRTWREWARDVFYRSDRNKRFQSNKPAPNHRLSQYLHDIVLRFNVTGDDEAKALADAINTLYLDLWSATKEHVDIRIAQGTVPLLLDLLPESIRSSHAPLMHSLAETALETYPHTVQSPVPQLQVPLEQQGLKTDNLFFRNYQPWSVIVPWMKLLSSLFPSNVEVISIGTSFEGREIQGLKVGKPGASEGKRKTIVITGAAHAREWISVSTVNYLAYSLITGYSRNDKAIDAMVENYDWIFLPTINVDGSVFLDHEETLD
jgi:extracellular matrix protein 14